ncbi:MAG: hypothetical protein OHM77_11065 [Candidatus Nitricoxidivorans perseverans]|uniref:Uncharacterized protein n=1 Tax=Candidatus Nitricoxidivorans perseverans TaxID=2975601 RepID=A0AA49FKF1_9PROT|nr:MAG: hypothetical protein OHM77_11065 [Candidatus Nitricoxidivorans perseverans]
MNARLDKHLSGGNGRLLGGELPGLHGREDDPDRFLAGGRNVLSGSRHLVGVQSFQSLQGLQEGLARLG